MILDSREVKDLLLKDKVVGITSGCFDLLHFYHLHYLERCAALCDFLIVGVDSDQLLEANKSKKPIIPEFHRVAMVAALRCVGAAFIMRNLNDLKGGMSIANVMFKNSPTIYNTPVIGGDDIKVVIIPDVNEVTSTSQIVSNIRSSETEK